MQVREAVVSYKKLNIGIEMPKPRVVNEQLKAVKLLKEFHPVDIDYTEAFTVMFLDRGMNLLCLSTIGIGTAKGVMVNTQDVFRKALLVGASSLILCHNHPSGNLSPSAQDDLLTMRLVEAGALFEIEIVDHIILTEYSYFSYAEERKNVLEMNKYKKPEIETNLSNND